MVKYRRRASHPPRAPIQLMGQAGRPTGNGDKPRHTTPGTSCPPLDPRLGASLVGRTQGVVPSGLSALGTPSLLLPKTARATVTILQEIV